MAHEKIRPQYFFDETKIEQLKQIAPECFEDGKINFETLRQNLGDWKEDEEDPDLEHFGLFWPGKRDARKAASLPPEGTLEPVWGEGLKADGSSDADGENDSKNVFIEGENLEVLKLLQKSYAGKIKMIYIDPPYNTGNDFVYDDNFTEPLQEYLRRTGQVDDEGKIMTTNKRSDGRFHSKWLSMIYPRLRLARNLMRDDGLIFVSIDDNEIHNLRAVMNEIFGEENLFQQLIWKNKTGGGAKTKGWIGLHEYILCYAKNSSAISDVNIPYSEKTAAMYNKKDENYEKRGPYATWPLDTTSMGDRPNLKYPIIYNDEEIWPEKQWLWSRERVIEAQASNMLLFNKQTDGSYKVRFKGYLKDEKGVVRRGKPLSIFDGPYTQEGSQDFEEHLSKTFFTFPKPVRLLKEIISIKTDEDINNTDEIILDFFAGSGTTAQAVLEMNKEDNGKRKFICVQLPELIDENTDAFKGGYKAISQISRKRVSSVIGKLTTGNSNANLGFGFRTVSLKGSNYKSWKNYEGTSAKDLETQLDIFNNNPLNDGWHEDGLLSELMLLEGFTLCSKIEKIVEIKSNNIRKVTSEYSEHRLLVCLDREIKPETIKALELSENDIFICLDSAISVADKLRLSDKGLIKTI
jgi:adenine-specific DNA-methyltransferase